MKYILFTLILALGLPSFAKDSKATKKASTKTTSTEAKTDNNKIPAVATIGQPAPDFSLPGHDGKTYKLSELKGKLVVLEWFNHDCPYVKKHYDSKEQNMQKTQSSLMKLSKDKGQELVWLTVVSSAKGKQGHITSAEAAKLKKDFKAHMKAFLFDEDGKVGHAYQAKTTPHMYVIDQNGILKFMGGIDDKPSARLDSLKGAQNYVLSAVKSVLDNKPIANSSTTPYGCSIKYL